MYLLDRDSAVKHRHRLAADVMHVEFIANANSQLQAQVGLFHNDAVKTVKSLDTLRSFLSFS